MTVVRAIAGRAQSQHVLTVGFLAIAGSSALLLGVGARSLNSEAFGGLGWVWTFSTVFGFGVATPLEQVINQRLSGGTARAVSSAAAAVVVACAAVALVVAGVAGTADPGDSFPYLTLSACVAVAGWVLSSAVRGRLAGQSRLPAYGLVMCTEAIVRAALVVSAWTVHDPALLLGLAVGGPTLLAGVLGVAVLLRRSTPSAVIQAVGRSSGLVSFVLVAVGYQVCLNGPPLILGWEAMRTTSVDNLGAFVVANAWLRTPTILVGGVSVAALSDLSRRWPGFDSRDWRAAALRWLWQGLGIAVLASAAAALAWPIAARVMYAGPTSIGVTLVIALALSTVLAVASTMSATALLARGRQQRAITAWATAAGATVVGLLQSGSSSTAVAVTLIVGPALALSISLSGLFASRRQPARTDAP